MDSQESATDNLGLSRDYKFSRGDPVFEIFSYDLKLYVVQEKVKQSYAYSQRVTTALEPYQGIKFSAFGQFNQTFRHHEERGKHLHMYRTYSSGAMLKHDVALFKLRFKRRTGITLSDPEFFI